MTTETQKSLVPWLIIAALAIALWLIRHFRRSRNQRRLRTFDKLSRR
jgi:hypothetical protein